MLYLVMAASFEKVVEADEIGLDIGIRVGDRVTYTSLCSKVNDNDNLVLGEDLLDGGFVGDRIFNESPVSVECRDFGQTFFLDIYIIVIGNRINTDDLDRLKVIQQPFHQITADEAGGTCYKNSLALKVYIML